MKISQSIAAALLASTLIFTLAGCDDQGPFEEAGEEVDDTFDDAEDAIEDASDGD